jgi:uncharacterized membrane protein
MVASVAPPATDSPVAVQAATATASTADSETAATAERVYGIKSALLSFG